MNEIIGLKDFKELYRSLNRRQESKVASDDN